MKRLEKYGKRNFCDFIAANVSISTEKRILLEVYGQQEKKFKNITLEK